MRCIHPFTRRYLDSITRVERVQECPCGKCIACLHNQQDSWAIRCQETAKAVGDFVYDTLTFSPSALPVRDVTRLVKHPLRIVSDESWSHLEYYCDGARYFAPDVDRSIIRSWIRNARESFYYDYGYRPKWRYLVTMEYGPATSRPHFHLLFFGISKPDYEKYLGNVWGGLDENKCLLPDSLGFHYPKYIQRSDYDATGFRTRYNRRKRKFERVSFKQDVECISRYISKYISKGVFESPLVKDGLCLKPFRCISHGLGVEYLSNKIFDYFRTPVSRLLKFLTVDTDKDPDVRCTTRRFSSRKWQIENTDILSSRFKEPDKHVLDRLVTYYDSLGRPHVLPRYYKQKLLDLHKPNLLSYAIQTLLYAYHQLYDNKKLAEFARSVGIYDADESAPALGLSAESFDLVCHQYAASRQSEAEAAAKRRFIELSNHYKRPMQDKAFAWVC